MEQVMLSLKRKQLKALYRRYRAILVLTNRLDSDERKQFGKIIDSIPSADPNWIIDMIPKLSAEVKKLEELYEVVSSTSDMEYYFDFDYDPKYPIRYVAKYEIQKLMKCYERYMPFFVSLPPHACIGIDLERENAHYDEAGSIVFILEADLFQDMAVLWNAAMDEQQKAKSEKDQTAGIREIALLRATTKAAFNLLEGYLNGMAVDILNTKSVDRNEKVKLTEWDEVGQRVKFLSLRDKLIQYPKIARGVEHPILDENNCEPMAYVLDKEKNLRHALIHPSPMIDRDSVFRSREEAMYQLGSEEVMELCDNVLDLIIQLHRAIDGMFGEVSNWLYQREETGRFSDRAILSGQI